jgi:PRTase ComF-like
LHRLTRGVDDRICATSDGDFSLEGYSLFKPGDERSARRFGHEIADFLMEEKVELFAHDRSDEVLVASFPYKYVPTAAALMVEHAITRLNHGLSGEDKPIVGYLHAFKRPGVGGCGGLRPALAVLNRASPVFRCVGAPAEAQRRPGR